MKASVSSASRPQPTRTRSRRFTADDLAAFGSAAAVIGLLAFQVAVHL